MSGTEACVGGSQVVMLCVGVLGLGLGLGLSL